MKVDDAETRSAARRRHLVISVGVRRSPYDRALESCKKWAHADDTGSEGAAST
eukprot:COSAG05_NODE_13763_length_418_cov_2.081505_1_plen_52_part_10